METYEVKIGMLGNYFTKFVQAESLEAAQHKINKMSVLEVINCTTVDEICDAIEISLHKEGDE